MTKKEARFDSADAVGQILRRLDLDMTGMSGWDFPLEVEKAIADPRLASRAMIAFETYVRNFAADEVEEMARNKAGWIKRFWKRVIPEHRAILRPVLRSYFKHARRIVEWKRGDIFMRL